MKSADITFKGVTKKRILLADDEPAMVTIIKFRLEHEGFEVVVATDGGEEALHQAVANGVIDLILLDIRMPKLDGFQVCKRLKENPATAKIPIIFTASESLVTAGRPMCGTWRDELAQETIRVARAA